MDPNKITKINHNFPMCRVPLLKTQPGAPWEKAHGVTLAPRGVNSLQVHTTRLFSHDFRLLPKQLR